ncbi:MAG: hypothetical protein H6661_07305 [Ardenticatenaceae bacterium]|nr:hypothetical protein [Ardenticatenaceae bacterium]
MTKLLKKAFAEANRLQNGNGCSGGDDSDEIADSRQWQKTPLKTNDLLARLVEGELAPRAARLF